MCTGAKQDGSAVQFRTAAFDITAFIFLLGFQKIVQGTSGDDTENCNRGNPHQYQMWIIIEACYQNLILLHKQSVRGSMPSGVHS